MTNMTLSMPDSLSKQMKKFSEVKWSEVARKAIIEKLDKLMLAEKLASKSKLTKKDVDEFNNKMKLSASKRFLS